MIRCHNCGTHVEEGNTKCPLCGETIQNEFSTNNQNSFFNQNSQNDMFKSPSLNKTFFSGTSSPNSSKSFFNQPSTSDQPSKEKNHLAKKQKYLLAIIGVVIIAIIAGCLIFSNSDDEEDTINPNNKIELSDVPTDDEETSSENEDPDNSEENTEPNEPSEPETPETKVMKFGSYSLEIPKGYNATQENDNAITIGNSATGYVITFEAGPYNIGAYRANDDEMTSAYERQNATVERIYDDNVASHDVHILEVDKDGTKFIIAITPSINKKAYIITLFNGFQKDSYDYGALTEALYISDNIKLSN